MDQQTPPTARRDEVLDRIVDICLAAGPIAAQTDKYFTNTSRIVRTHGDAEVTFAVFMRRRVVAALEPTIRLIQPPRAGSQRQALLRRRRHRAFRNEDAGDHRLDGEALGDRDAAPAEDRLSLRLRQQRL